MHRLDLKRFKRLGLGTGQDRRKSLCHRNAPRKVSELGRDGLGRVENLTWGVCAGEAGAGLRISDMVEALGSERTKLGATGRKSLQRIDKRSAPVAPSLPPVIADRMQRQAGCAHAHHVTCSKCRATLESLRA